MAVPADFDLNLLRVLDAVVSGGSVTAAARTLHLSVPATSRALERLRRAMGDPIMVRSGRGLVPTPFAVAAKVRARAVLDAAEALRVEPETDPASWRRTFSVRVNDGLAPVLGPVLLRRVADEAPGVTVRLVAQDSKSVTPLRDGALDLDVGNADPPPADVREELLFSDALAIVVAADSTLGRADELTVDDLTRNPHVSASRRGLDHGPLDAALAELGRSRRVTAVVPNYAVAALLALEPGLLAIVPAALADHLIERRVPLTSHSLPVRTPAVDVHVRWHARVDADPASMWLRDHVRATAAEVDTPR